MKYRLKPGFTHYETRGEPMPAGTVIEMTEDRYRAVKDRFEPVDGDDAHQAVVEPDTVEDEPDLDEGGDQPDLDFIEEMTVRQVVELMEADPDQIQAILNTESRGRNRIGILNAGKALLRTATTTP